MKKVTVRTGSNIAFIKYWGVSDASIHLPLSDSISMTLSAAHTTTTFAWDETNSLIEDEIMLDGKQLDQSQAARLVRHLDHIRQLGGIQYRAKVISENNFPMASGIASSASGFSALTVAGCAALELDLTSTQLSAIARLGSGSASRSLFGGFVEWTQGHDHKSSVAHQMYGPEHWALYDIVAVVSSAMKETSSANGHTIALSSPLLEGRIQSLETALPAVREAIANRDLAQLGPVIEQDALTMCSVMMTSRPSLLYWQPGTVELMKAVRYWREVEHISVYFTIDAGPNLHLICEEESVKAVQKRLTQLDCVQRAIVSKPGPGPLYLDTHLG